MGRSDNIKKVKKRKKAYRNPGRPINHMPVIINETGRMYDSYADAAKAIHGHKGDILLCLRGLRKTHKGFTFRYARPDELYLRPGC